MAESATPLKFYLTDGLVLRRAPAPDVDLTPRD